MASYNPPTELLPIFNPGVWNTALPGGGISQATADGLYVSLATSQGVPSTKTYNTTQIFDNIAQFNTQSAIAGGQAQTIKSNTAPFIARLYNVNPTTSTDIVLPQSSGTLAITSQIPDSSDYVDLTTNQVIGGTKTFSLAPVMSSISNTGVLTLPISTDTLVGRATTDTLTNKTLIAVAGLVGTPSISFAGGTNTGFYKPVAIHQIGVTCNGVQRGLWSTSGLAVTGALSATTTINGDAGTVSAPSYTFTGDTDTGIYSSAANTIDLTTNGVNRLSLSDTVLDSTVIINNTVFRGKGGPSTNILVVSQQTNDDVGTVILRITPSTAGWLATGTSTIQFGDLNHTVSVVNGTAMTLNVPTEIRSSISGTQRLRVSSTGINITGIAQTSIPMACMMTKSTAQSTGTGAAVSVVNYNVSSNPSSYFTLNTTLGTITFTVSDAPCMMFVSGQIQFPSSTVGNRGLWIEDSGSGLRWVDANRNATSDPADTSKTTVAGMRMITANATYTLIMKIYQNTGGTINSGGIAATNLTTFACARIN